MLTTVRHIFGRIMHSETALHSQWDKGRKNNLLFASPSIRRPTVVADLNDCLCPEDLVEFDYYSTISEDALSSNIYMLLCEIASYICEEVMMEHNWPLPEYLDVGEDDFTEFVLEYVKNVNENYFEDYKLQKVLTYCQEKQKENKNIKFSKEEILKISF